MIEPLSRDELLALPPVVDVVTAGRALGIGRGTAYRLVRQGAFPLPVLSLGSRHVVVAEELRRLLQVTAADSAR